MRRVKYYDRNVSDGKMSCMGSMFSISDEHILQWDGLIRKFSDDCKRKELCKAKIDLPYHYGRLKQFDTGSSYEGSWNIFGMEGHGVYRYPNGVEYEGEIEDGEFHGDGVLRYPSGIIIRGKWVRGELREKTIVFADGVEYKEKDWQYCQQPDRRFPVGCKEGIQPSGRSFMTAEQPTRPIPLGHYDTCDGFYHPKTKMIYSYEDPSHIVRPPGPAERKWIEENCRSNVNEIMGPCSHLYEHWTEPQPEKTDAISISSEYTDSSNDPLWTGRDRNTNEDTTVSVNDFNVWTKRPFSKFDPAVSHQEGSK